MGKMERKVKAWITVNGKHVPIMEGESKSDAVTRSLHDAKHAQQRADNKKSQIANNKELADKKNQPDSNAYEDADDYDSFVKKNMKSLKVNIIDKGGDIDDVRQEWYSTRAKQELKTLKEVPIEDAIKQVRKSVPMNVIDGWFRNADSDYKPKLLDSIFSNKGTLNAGLNIAYYNYKETGGKLSFKEWLNAPQKVYRGSKGQKSIKSDMFMSYSLDKKAAEKFGSVQSITIKPIDTWGSYQTTGEQEWLVPNKKKFK